MLPEWIRAFLTYHRIERKGLLVLMLLIGLVVSYNMYLRITLTARAKADLLRFGPSIAEFSAEMEASGSDSVDYRHAPPWESTRSERPKAELFNFDPNTLDSAGWVRLGFSPKQSASIVRYRSRGGSFRKEEDLLKLFMVDSARYLELRPYVKIAPREEQPRESAFPPAFERAPLPMVDINLADTLELEDIKGIGPAFARRIFRYRERLGGFRSPEQLLEIFGMDTARYEDMLPQVMIDTTVRSRININTAEYTELIRHPYLNKNQVRAIIRYREQHGAYRSVNDLLNIHLVKEEDMRRLGPYLKVE